MSQNKFFPYMIYEREKQLECITKDKQKDYTAKKRRWDINCMPTKILEQIPHNKSVELSG